MLLRVQPHLLALNRAKIPRGLALSVPLNSNRFVGIPYGNATFDPVPTINGSPQLARTPWGIGLKADGTATSLAYALHTGQASATFWSMEAFVWVTGATADGGVCGWDDSNNLTSGVTDRYLNTANVVTNWSTDLYDGGNSVVTAGSAAVGIHHIVCTYGNGVQSLYVDGLLAGSNTGLPTGGYTGYATPNFMIGAVSTAVPTSFNGGVILLVNWANACWNYNEVRARWLDPWGMFRPEPLNLTFSLPAATGGVTFIPRRRKRPRPRLVLHKRKRAHHQVFIVNTLSLGQADWAWKPNPAALSRITQPAAPKAWVWSPNAIIETAITTPAAKSWAWAANTMLSQRVTTMARRAWNWTANPPAFSGIAIAYHVVKRAVGLKAKTRFQQD